MLLVVYKVRMFVRLYCMYVVHECAIYAPGYFYCNFVVLFGNIGEGIKHIGGYSE